MKRTILISIFTVYTLISAMSQESKTFIGGGLMFQSNNSESDYESNKLTRIQISPTIGKMVSDKVAIGLNLGYAYYKMEDRNSFYGSIYNNQNYLTISPFVRIQHKITDNFKLYSDQYIGGNFALNDKTDNKPLIYYAGIGCGFMYFVTHKMSLEFNLVGLNYIHTRDKDDNYKQDTFDLNYNLSNTKVGLKYYF